MEMKTKKVIYAKCFNFSKLRAHQYEKSKKVAENVLKEIDSVLNKKNAKFILAIEGSSFSKNSSSLEAMAKSRQAAYDIFTNHHLYEGTFIEVNPTSVKHMAGAKTKEKDEIYKFANDLYPQVFKKYIKYRVVTKGKDEGKKVLKEDVKGMADAIVIALTALDIHTYGKPTIVKKAKRKRGARRG